MIRRLFAQLHLWIGLLLCLPLVMLGITGSILVLEDEFRWAFGSRAKASAEQGESHAITDIIAAAAAVAPAGYMPVSYAAPPLGGRASVRLAPTGRGAAGERLRVDIDPVSLEASANPETGFFRQVFFLHSTLLMRNREGRQLVGWLGVAMLVMATSGLINWWPRRHRWRAAFGVSPNAQGFRLYRELHGAAGIWGLAVLVIVSFGGVYLAFPENVRSIVDPLLPARDLRAAAAAIGVEPVRDAAPLGADAAVALARSRFPDTATRLVLLPARPDQPIRVLLSRAGEDRHAPSVTVAIDQLRGQVIETFDPRQFSAGETLLAWQHALHAGEGLGPLWKALVFVCGLLPLLFAVSGILMWRLKQRRNVPAAITVDTSFLDHANAARRAGE